MDDDVATADFAEEDALGAVVEERDKISEQEETIVIEKPAEPIMA